MLLNGKELTQQQIEQCVADHNLGGEKLTKKYKLDQGGEHPIVTKAAWEGARKRTRSEDNPNWSPYHQWCWMRLAMIAHEVEAK